MKPRRILTPRDTAELFDHAVQEQALAVLTLQVGTEWSSFKSRFLERDPRGRFFVLDYVMVDGSSPPELVPGQYVGVSFRHRNHKLLFATVAEARGHFVRPDQSTVAAVRYRWPSTLTELQRRAYFRTPVPEDTQLHALLWAGGVRARGEAEGKRGVVSGHLVDLSCGGTLIRLIDQPPSEWREGMTLGAELQLPDGRAALVVDVRYRGARVEVDGHTTAAVQFIGLEVTVDGTAVLQRLANSVQKLHRTSLAVGRRDWGSNRPR